MQLPQAEAERDDCFSDVEEVFSRFRRVIGYRSNTIVNKVIPHTLNTVSTCF